MKLKTISTNIRKMCKSKGIRIADLTNDLGLCKGFLSNIDAGSAPSIESLYKIAVYLDTSIDRLTGLYSAGSNERDKLLDFFSSLSDDELRTAAEIIRITTKKEPQ